MCEEQELWNWMVLGLQGGSVDFAVWCSCALVVRITLLQPQFATL